MSTLWTTALVIQAAFVVSLVSVEAMRDDPVPQEEEAIVEIEEVSEASSETAEGRKLDEPQ